MLVTNHRAFADCEAFADRWDGLAAGCAFRTWQWLSVWWEHYGAQRRSRPTASAFGTRRLAILAAHDDQSPNGVNQSEPVAILPAYVDISLARGRVLRLLGDGEVCSDHLGMLAAPDAAAAAAAAIARHLASSNQWDAVEFSSVDSDDRTTQFLFHELAQHGFSVGRETGPRCWSIELPDSWDEFLQMQSKSHRKQLRRAARRLEDDGRCRWRIVKRPSELDDAWENLIELHQRRRRSLGEPGCFTSPSWASFHRSISSRMLAAGRLRLSSLEINGVAAAAEYHFVGGRTTFAYQGGVSPEMLGEEPGRLSMIGAVKQAIAEGRSRFDLLRGDEPYKAHWRAAPIETYVLRAVGHGALTRLREGARSGLRFAKCKVKHAARASREALAPPSARPRG